MEVSCQLAPKSLLKGDGKTLFKFAVKHGLDKPYDLTAKMSAYGYSVGGVKPWSTL